MDTVVSTPTPNSQPGYAELHCLSSFSFQRGASQPEELVQRAHALGYRALALTDECSVAGVVRAHTEAERLGLQLLPGAEFHAAVEGGSVGLVVLPHDLEGWGQLCEFISRARGGTAPKGQYHLRWDDAPWHDLHHCEVLLQTQPPVHGATPAPALPDVLLRTLLRQARAHWREHLWLSLTLGLGADDALQLLRLRQLSAVSGVPLVATGHVHMHVRSRKPLHDVLTAVRMGLPVVQCGYALQANAELHLRTRARLATLYPPELLQATLQVAARCHFSLKELRYRYPKEAVLPGQTAAETLRYYTEEGAQTRYPQGVPPAVRKQIEHELALITELRYEMYFLTVHDIVRFARQREILCQGRGSAANSAVCYCLGVTEVDPARTNLLFERFISRERDEPPDIDVDFEHQRREEVIQYIYQKYGRERAAITAVVTSYRPRSALRDVGRALEIPEVLVTALCKEHPGMYSREVLAERLQSAIERVAGDGNLANTKSLGGTAGSVSAASPGGAALSSVSPARSAGSSFTYAERSPSRTLVGERNGFQLPSARRLELWVDLARQLQRFPRHLSQHVGGFVLTEGLLTRLVPVENASMPERSVIQWDKDDLDAVGLLKVDVLALGMLSAIRRCLALIGQWRGAPLRMQDIPAEDSATYDMICAADTVGVFQIESRAQMSMLPRLKPRCFYDLVVEVAIVRPGPIQGGMVHPYLKARANPQAVQYASPALEEALKRTLGVPIFQEQVMQIAMAAASFSPGEADQLRRSMAAWKRKGGVHRFYDRLVGGMLKNGYTEEFAQQLFRQIEGFGEYGFPESHAASFALLVYVSCWLKHHEPACFLAAMLNSQPLGFYGPSQLVQDARRHGVAVRAADVICSDWDCTLEVPHDPASQQPAVRLGLRMVGGLAEAAALRIVQARQERAFADVQDMALRSALDTGALRALASADALHTLAGHRRQQVWEASALRPAPALLRGVPVDEEALVLPAASPAQEVVADYASTGLSLRAHPLSFLRPQLEGLRLQSARQLHACPHGRLVRACGIVTMRQQPQTAKGVVFVTLEDETGSVNVIVWKAVRERQRHELHRARLMAVYGVWQRDDQSRDPAVLQGDRASVMHLIAGRLVDLTHLLGELATSSRDFH